MAGIYLHIPFCRQACTYCNFHFSTSLNRKNELIDALLLEIELQRNYLGGQTIETVYFGGGTPSLLSADELKRITDTIAKFFNLNAVKEFTLEANPDDLGKNYIRDLRSTLINRLSIGVQSFHDSDLRYMNRAHNASQSESAIKAAQDAGFSNLSIDLIYGTPGLSNELWKENLRRVSEYEVPHFSSYALTVEEGTALHHNIEKKKSEPVLPEQAATQLEILMEEADRNGFIHYEISNLAKPDHFALHNTNYWRGVPYLGIGPSAHSFNGEERRWNAANNSIYTQSLLAGRTIPFESEMLTDHERLNEYIMTSLRTIWGLDLEKVEREFGTAAVPHILRQGASWIEAGKLLLNKQVLTLSSAGRLFADRIASDLFMAG